ncbi:MAG: DUF4242 domain-containing protein [Chloroflexi bacterium]|jgi:hypothetical protein|nr:MAG: hypothetical protein BZY84_05575 [SAR202 cluster bacterium MP-SInd-SRR3963457-G1]PKB85103.1 MAG: hypothetical protein BZY86_04135 [SAR202 cluster bacterium MP-NPac-SRR3961935-G1]RUA20183.1 MAG: DUF4242 domain-containing protein [Chloroflexota bacterium]RUA29031.1 MAG: DUF4242 domain-containing protein [Chloroflexota bacterium]|tara:strand:- start:396 stop:671 length:276 start_codon:yes stop_codon:yes gene_type:complete
MPQYVVERHLPNFTGEMVAAAAKRAKQTTLAMTREGTPVRYMRSIFIPGEDKCYCLFEGESADTVRQANERAELPVKSISEAWSITTVEIT